jgi:hypothetical protein
MNDGQGTKLKSGLQTPGRPRAPIRHQPHSPGQTRQFKIQGKTPKCEEGPSTTRIVPEGDTFLGRLEI